MGRGIGIESRGIVARDRRVWRSPTPDGLVDHASRREALRLEACVKERSPCWRQSRCIVCLLEEATVYRGRACRSPTTHLL